MIMTGSIWKPSTNLYANTPLPQVPNLSEPSYLNSGADSFDWGVGKTDSQPSGTGPTGPNYLGWANTTMSGLNAIGSIMGARTAKKNYKLQRDAFNFNKEMQSATTLANIQNRMNQYRTVNPNADVSHLESLAARLQSYLPNQQGQQPNRPANQTQQPVAQNTPQPTGGPAGYDSLARYGRGG